MAFTLGTVILAGADASKPAAGEPGRLYFSTDTKKVYRDNGTSWDDETPLDPVMVGDSGSGGAAGLAPAPAAGTAAAGKFLKADGTWAVPPGSSSFLEEVLTVSGTSATLAHAPTALIGIFRNGLRLRGAGTSSDYSVASTTLTLNFTPGGSDVFVAVYFY